MAPRTKPRSTPKSQKRKNSSQPSKPQDFNFWAFILTLLVACAVSFYIILDSSSQNTQDLRHYNSEDLSKKLIEVKKSALPFGKILDFNRYKDNDERRRAAIDVVFNQMLSETEDRLGIPAAAKPSEVAANFDGDLIRLYGDPVNVPADVYRTACLRIMNSRSDFKKFYKGSPKEMERIVTEVLCDYYGRGKLPSTMQMSDLEKNCRLLKKKKS